APRTLIHPTLDVNSWANNDPDVEAARPSHCAGCERTAHRADYRNRESEGNQERPSWRNRVKSGRNLPDLHQFRVFHLRATLGFRAVEDTTLTPRFIVPKYFRQVTVTAAFAWPPWPTRANASNP
ncbi:MAG: hypothetical protein AB1Z98_15010, partial [Nannocystaceae bacterium]